MRDTTTSITGNHNCRKTGRYLRYLFTLHLNDCMPWVVMSEITDDGRLFQIFTAAGRKALSKLLRVLAAVIPWGTGECRAYLLSSKDCLVSRAAGCLTGGTSDFSKVGHLMHCILYKQEAAATFLRWDKLLRLCLSCSSGPNPIRRHALLWILSRAERWTVLAPIQARGAYSILLLM